MKIAITGATGFVGAAMVRYFAAQGHEILAIGRTSKPSTLLTQQANYLQADISKSVPSFDCDYCIHSAALATDQASYTDYFETNYMGTKRVFEAANCRKFIQISTSSVYHFEQAIHEEEEIIPFEKLSDYGKTKWLAEVFLQKEKNQGTSIFILRPRAIYGSGDRVLLPRILNLVRGGKIWLPGDLKVDCSMTHIDNLIQAVEKCISCNFDFRVYNVGDQPIYQLRQVMETLVNAIFEKKTPIYELNLTSIMFLAKILKALNIPTRLSPLSINSITRPSILNIEKITQELNYLPIKNFYNSSHEIIAWVKKIGLEKILNVEKDLAWNI